MNLLALETSGEFCSVAACRADRVFERHFEAGRRHSELALAAVDEVLREAGLALADLSGIAFGEGPGSFTGLRIACSLTQGLALAASLPVLGIGTLLALAEASGERSVIACLDARMGEVYHAAYLRDAVRDASSGATHGATWREVHAPGLHAPDAVPEAQGSGWVGCGSGFAAHVGALAARCAGRLERVRADVVPTARAVLALSRERFAAGAGRGAEHAVPIYLRDKVALKMSERP